MNRNVVIGIVVVLALAVVGWWYWAMMVPVQAPAAIPAEDAAAGGDVSTVQSVMELSGTWRSKEDPRFVRIFTTDGSVTDVYEGDESATVTGTWSVVEDPATERPELPAIENTQVIKVQFDEEVMYFGISLLTESDLSLIYLSGNGSLEFSRVN